VWTLYWAKKHLSVSVCLSVVLEPYKYAGYPMLIKTVMMETQDDTLFSKAAPLLSAATELCYHTVNCSALNAEELRRERGIEVCHYLLLSYSLAVSALTLLVGRQEQHSACEKLISEVLGVDICLERGANNLHMVQLMPLPSLSSLASLKSDWFQLVGTGLPRLSWKRSR